MRFLLVGPDFGNSTDGFIVRGIHNLLYESFGIYTYNYLFLDDHQDQSPDAFLGTEYDAIIVCGTPWIWDRFYKSWKYKNLIKIFEAYPNTKRIFFGIGTCVNLDRMNPDDPICVSPQEIEAMQVLYKDALVICRESLAKTKLDKAAVQSYLMPCPGFYSVDNMDALRPPAFERIICWAEPRMTISGGYWREHAVDIIPKFIKPLMRDIVRKTPVYIAKPGETSPFEETMEVLYLQNAIDTIASTNEIISMRVHWAVPALAMGKKAELMALDSRALTFNEVKFEDIEINRPKYKEILSRFIHNA